MKTNQHWHITGDGLEEQIITTREIVRGKFVDLASYLAGHALTVTGSYNLRIWTCKDAACLPFDPVAEERKRQEELARLPVDPSEEMKRRYDPNFLDGGA